MLPKQPKVCVVWMRSRCPLDSKLGVSVPTCTTASCGHYSWGFLTVPWSQKKQPWILLSCCYMEAGLLIKSEPDLRGNGKGTSTLLAGVWELPSVMPAVRIPQQEKRRPPWQCNMQRKGNLLLTRARAPAATNAVVQSQRAPSPSFHTHL